MSSKMETKESSDEVFQVDTKGLCLLCLRDGCSSASYADSVAYGGHSKNTSYFKVLLRYLKINTYKLCNFSSTFLQNMDALEDTNIAISLCSECGDMTKMFSKLYQDMEVIRLRMDSCLQSLHASMKRSKRSEIRMFEYRKRMRSRNMYEMFNASVADNLRNETMKKCSEVVDALIPRVAVIHQEHTNLKNSFQFPLLSTQPRKIPGPKSKTMGASSSKLKALLVQQDVTVRGQFASHAFLRNGMTEGGTSTMEGLECSEEFVVKVEPSAIGHDMNNFHNENEDDNDFSLEDASVIANYDGQLIGHFLGGTVDTKRTSQNSMTLESSSLDEKAGAFDCPYCPKTFLSVASLGGHLHVHKNRQKIKAVNTSKEPIKKIKKRGMKKKKIKCAHCKKTLTSEESYRTHMKRFHPKNGVGDKIFDCEICGKRFFQHTVHRTHMVSLHAMHVFSKYLPPGTTEEQLDTAIQGVCAQFREVMDPSKKKSKLYGCQFCTQVLPHPSHLRLHVLRSHFDKVVLMLQSLFNANVEIETEDGEGNDNGNGEENEDGDGEGNEYGDGEGNEDRDDEGNEDEHVGGDLDEEEDEDIVDPEPMPILLSMAYSLSEEGDDNTYNSEPRAGDDGNVQKGSEDYEELSNDDPLLDS